MKIYYKGECKYMIDKFNRKITYARISLTEKCNLKCKYCMPKGFCAKNSNELSDEQIKNIIKALLDLGINKIRFTGGEPLMRKNAIGLLNEVCSFAPIEWVITTNGTTLKRDALALKKAGIKHINISLDTLDSKDYKNLTGSDLKNALDGLYAALDAGFDTIRINAVLIKGISEKQIENLAKITLKHNIDVRFIELMPIGQCAEYSENHLLKANAVLDILKDLKIGVQDAHAPAKYYKFDGAKGRVGLIAPMSCNFCSECNRIRITADGKLKPCLHSDIEINLCDVLHNEDLIKKRIQEAVNIKPERHYLDENIYIKRNMTCIGG